MKGRVVVMIAIIVLLGGLGVVVGLLAKHGPDNHESAPVTPLTPEPTEKTSAAPEPESTTASERPDKPDKEEALKLVRSRAEKYIAAINAKNEAAAAPFTCRKKDASLLWVAAAGLQITLLDVDGPFPPSHELGALPWWSVGAKIQIGGKPSSSIVFVLKDGEWCVYP